MRFRIATVVWSPATAICLLAAVFGIILFVLPPGGFFIGDQGVKYLQIDAISRTHALSVGRTDELLSVFRPAFAHGFYRPVGSGAYQAVFSPAYAAVVSPFYLLFGMRGLVIPSILGTLLVAYASGRIARLAGARQPALAVLVTGLASPLCFYAFTLWEHSISVGLIAVGIYLALGSRYFAAGISLAVSVWLRPETVLFGPSVAGALVVSLGLRQSLRCSILLLGGFLAGLVPWWAYNLLKIGTVWGAQVQANQYRLARWDVGERLNIVAMHLLPIGQRKWMLLIAMALLIWVALRAIGRSAKPALLVILLGVVGLSCLNLRWLANGVALSMTDVFPFAFAAILSLTRWTEKEEVRFLWSAAGIYVIGIVCATPTWGDGGWGPRMLLGAYVPLGVLGLIGLEHSPGRSFKLAVLALLVVSVASEAAGILFLRHQQRQITRLNEELSSLEPPAVATSIWWLPQVAAPTFRQIRWYGVVEEQEIDAIGTAEKGFWWVWTEEPESGFDTGLEHVATLPGRCLRQGTIRRLPARGLHAVLYVADCGPAP